MNTNAVRALWAGGERAINGWLSIGNSFSAEIMAAQGFDCLTVDLQHGVVDYATAIQMFQAMGASGVMPMARISHLSPSEVTRVLDGGAMGLICPMINTRADAEALVSYARYAPNGIRSFGPTRAAIALGPGYDGNAEDELICFAMVETAEAMNNLDAICSTPGLDGIYVGPSDLTLALTGRRYRVGFDREEPEMVEAIKRILTTAHKHGIKGGLHTGSAAYASRAIDWGFDLVTAATDVRLLAENAKQTLQTVRGLK
ncbi:4-hydroxy-2-oxoheptanedioate aldolase [Devosia subaequoris]|uniref:4-hydroxy-2-oxoheptanedioate aldolase n=1 Tax=Devosia subaequoris TaxID=395930 RepID=A0A7W6IRI8_9HYPH|nr:aldolase/citrate lyase family protein [Devosia subaequoris]MBB4053947.1 4-hydroxy-2-oxoheptanedioate aldolase [Devosia subaequoris]MCP1211451.1 aldolase/citrate lyase family protein [Devosia subaequoris]